MAKVRHNAEHAALADNDGMREKEKARRTRIEGIKSIEAKTYILRLISKREAKTIFQEYEPVEKSFVTDFFESKDSRKQPRKTGAKSKEVKNVSLSVRFPGRSVGNLRGVFIVNRPSIIADTREIFENSVYAYSSNYIIKTPRYDGSVHKEHPDVEAYHHFVNKIVVGGNSYYVRFTVEEERKTKGRLHSAVISRIEITQEKSQQVAPTELEKYQGEGAKPTYDDNLTEFFNSVNTVCCVTKP
jgi:hypothetical protein